MTVRSSLDFPFRNAVRVVSQNRKMTIVSCILYLLGIPLAMGATLLEMIHDSHREDIDFEYYYSGVSTGLYMGLGIFFLGVAVFLGMFAAVNSLTELHSKSKVDMLYSLPLNGTQRFFSDYLGGCVMYIFPYIVSVVIGWILLVTMGNMIDFNSSYTDVGFAWMCKYYALATFGLLSLMLLYYTMSFLITVCCGTLFECIYTNFLMNLLIPGCMAAVLGVITSNVALEFDYTWYPIGFTSPIGGLIYLFYLLSRDELFDYNAMSYSATLAAQTSSHEMLPSYFRWIFWILVFTAILLVAAWQLYKRRKAEAVGSTFVYIAAYFLLLILVTVTILCLMAANVVGPAILFSAIVFFIMEVIRKRGFRKFWLSIITYIVTVGVAVGGFYLTIFTGVFGRVNYVPAASLVSSVAVTFDYYGTEGDYEINLEYTDRDIIRQVTEFHKEVVRARQARSANLKNLYEERYNQNAINQALREQELMRLEYTGYDSYYDTTAGYRTEFPSHGFAGDSYTSSTTSSALFRDDDTEVQYGNSFYVELTYYTLTGSSIHRNYSLNADENEHFQEIFIGTPLFAEAMENGMNYMLKENYSEYDSDTHVRYVPESIQLRLGYDDKNTWRYSDNTTSQNIRITGGESALQKIAAAYRQDWEGMTPADFRTAKQFGSLCGLPVYENFGNTIELLKGWGFREFTLSERYRFSDDASWNYDSSALVLGIRLYAPGTYAAASLEFPCSTVDTLYFKEDADGVPAYEDVYYPGKLTVMQEIYPELYDLMEAAQSHYITEERCYVLVVNNNRYIIPPEHTDLAEAVIAKGSEYGIDKIESTGSSLYTTMPDLKYSAS